MTDASKTKFINAKRRGFLQGAAVAGGAVASGAAVSGESVTGETQPISEQPATPTHKGYEKNEYVKRYYARARI